MSDRKTPFERRFRIPPFHRPVIPFGAMVEYHPISDEELSRQHQFGPKDLARYIPWMCIKRGGDIMVADIEELEEMDASELHARRLNAKEVLTPRRGDIFTFPIAENPP